MDVLANYLLCWGLVDSIVELAFSSPESPVEDKAEEKDRDRVACSASLVHQVLYPQILVFLQILADPEQPVPSKSDRVWLTVPQYAPKTYSVTCLQKKIFWSLFLNYFASVRGILIFRLYLIYPKMYGNCWIIYTEKTIV
jgi:hypothetical protein